MSENNDPNAEIRKLATEAKEETLALSAVCASLPAELAMLHKSPREKLTQMTAALMGVADGVSGHVSALAMSKLVERIATTAETLLVAEK
jgi:hypothetical protein